jgi:hypothetical protein
MYQIGIKYIALINISCIDFFQFLLLYSLLNHYFVHTILSLVEHYICNLSGYAILSIYDISTFILPSNNFPFLKGSAATRGVSSSFSRVSYLISFEALRLRVQTASRQHVDRQAETDGRDKPPYHYSFPSPASPEIPFHPSLSYSIPFYPLAVELVAEGRRAS